MGDNTKCLKSSEGWVHSEQLLFRKCHLAIRSSGVFAVAGEKGRGIR